MHRVDRKENPREKKKTRRLKKKLTGLTVNARTREILKFSRRGVPVHTCTAAVTSHRLRVGRFFQAAEDTLWTKLSAARRLETYKSGIRINGTRLAPPAFPTDGSSLTLHP